MTVSMIALTCPFQYLDVIGTNLVGDENLRLKDLNGNYTTFVVTIPTPYLLRLSNFNPALTNGVYQLEYNGKLLFEMITQCPPQDLSGIYQIDPARKLMRDTYNQVLKKIPDPTIRTAMIGE
jgi:hypothetical protein